jgi:hypothetical protein
MLFDNQGEIVPPSIAQEEFDIKLATTRDAQGNITLSTSSPLPPGISGAPKETYRGAGSGTELKPNTNWEPVGAGDVYNLRSLGVSSKILGL